MPDFAAVISLADLDGSNGFRIDGIEADDVTGASVSAAGDVNGDGVDDILIGAYGALEGAGITFVVFGRSAGGFSASFDLFTLDGTNGFALGGVVMADFSGASVSSAGDVNNDGFDDVIIGAPFVGFNSFTGAAYVVFGKSGGFAAGLSLAALDGTNGFRLEGSGNFSATGRSVSAAGDVNGDGFDDVIVGAGPANVEAGESYVVFGKAGGFAASFESSSLDGGNGFRLIGVTPGDYSGRSVSAAGDVNGDGYDDVVIGAYKASRFGEYYCGQSYVVFGKPGGFAADFALASLDGANGFRLVGTDSLDISGKSVSGAGDINGDGFDDVVIGALGGDPGGDSYAGEAYVVFGRAGGFAVGYDLSTLDGTNGFRIDGIDAEDLVGCSVSDAGDVNGDGFDDLIIGAYRATPGAADFAGKSYVVFGMAGGFAASLDLATLDGSNGFRIDGIDAGDYSGRSVSAAGDVNGDGFDDVIIGAPYGDPLGYSDAGEGYVVFGRAPTSAVERIGSAASQAIRGGDFADTLDGAGGKDSLYGDKGDDELIGGGGGDRMAGGQGDDRYRVQQANDRVLERAGEGDDTVLAFVDFSAGTQEIETIIAKSAAGLSLAAGEHGALVMGAEGADTLIGGAGGDTLIGAAGRDKLTGGGGADRLVASEGRDVLKGAGGGDIHALAKAVAGADSPVIKGFAGNDRIEVDAADFRAGLDAGPLDSDAFVANANGLPEDAGDRFIYETDTGRLWFDADGSGAGARRLIAKLSGAPALDAGDFLIVDSEPVAASPSLAPAAALPAGGGALAEIKTFDLLVV